MLTKFWESTGEGLSANWLQQFLGPAFLFWSGGLCIFIMRLGFYNTWYWITTRDIPTQSAVLIIGVLIITLSGRLMEQLRLSFMRVIEGYWSWPFNYLSIVLSKLQSRLIQRDRDLWNILMDKHERGSLTHLELQKLSELEIRNHYTPADLNTCLPTSLGNILRAAESEPAYRYGLDAAICWPRLWLVMPKDAKDDLISARQRLDILVELLVWGLLFSLWSSIWIWALTISIIWMLIALHLILEAARVYADLLGSSFDLYRWDLYRLARWPLPAKAGSDEIILGKALTQFIWRGYTEDLVTFTKPESSKP